MFKHLYFFISCILLLFSFVLHPHTSKATDFEFGKLTHRDSTITNYTDGPACNAVILNEFGVLTFSKSYPYRLIHQYHVKIKVFKADALTYGDISISFYKWNNNLAEKITRFDAVVYTPGTDGKFRKTVCNISGGRFTNQSNHLGKFSYALPNVLVGSIIEYRYDLETPDKNDFTPWAFQKELPKIHSEYWVHMPPKLDYDVILKGGYKLSKNYTDSAVCEEHKGECSVQVYAMDSIRAFIAEDRMTEIIDYIPALYFYKVILNYNTKTKKIASKDWSDFDMEALASVALGQQLQETDFFKRKLKKIILPTPDTLALAKSLYSYINHHIKWNERLAPASQSIQSVFKEGKGTSADINLMLITALKAYGINANPILISTKNHGAVDKYLPQIGNFNHVIATTNIGNTKYLLDATDPMLPFGMLPEYCFNDYGRVLSEKDSCYWIKMHPQYPASTNYTVELTLKPDGGFKGTAISTHNGYSSYTQRKFIKSFNNTDEYIEKLKNTFNGIKVLNVTTEGLDTITNRVRETYDIEILKSINNSPNKIYFNPYVFDEVNANPFNLDNRTYPIDCGLPSEQRFVISVHLPQDYEIESRPQETAIALPGNGGFFSTSFNYVNNTAIFSHIIKLNRSVYSPDEYPYLKELFNKIIQVQKLPVILKRKS